MVQGNWHDGSRFCVAGDSEGAADQVRQLGILLCHHYDDAKINRLYEANEAAADCYHDILMNTPKVLTYLKDRGINHESITKWRLGFSSTAFRVLPIQLKGFTADELLMAGLIREADRKRPYDSFRARLMFPIRNKEGRITGFGARSLEGSGPKFINSPQTPIFKKSTLLYGLDLAWEEIIISDKIIIVEGYFDAIMAHQHGFNNVVASMGLAVTDGQLAVARDLTPNIHIALDGDKAGRGAIMQLAGMNENRT